MFIKKIVLSGWHTMKSSGYDYRFMVSRLCIKWGQLWHSWDWNAKMTFKPSLLSLLTLKFQDSTELPMQTNKWFTYRQKWLQLCFSLLFSFIFYCHASMTFALWHFSSCDTRANISSVKQYQICLGLLFCDVHICSCVWAEQTDQLKPVTGLCGGDKWRKDRVITRECWRKMFLRRLCRVTGVTSHLYFFSFPCIWREKKWKLQGYKKKLRLK